MLGPLWTSSRLIQVINTTKGIIRYEIPLAIEAPCPKVASITLEIPTAVINSFNCPESKTLKEIVIKPLPGGASTSFLAELR